MRDRPVVLVVTTALVPEQLATWRYGAESGEVDLHLAGSLVHDPSESYMAPLSVPDWGTVHVLPAEGLVSRGRLWWNLRGLEELIRSIRPDVVHVHSEVWGRLVTQALRGGAPVVAHGAENVSLDHGGKLEATVRKMVSQRNAKQLAGYASWNDAGCRIVRGIGLPGNAPTAVAPAIVPDPEPFLRAGSARVRKTGGPLVVGYLGRLIPEKGVQWLLGALDGVSGVELLVVGSGPYEGELRRQAARRRITVDFRGAVEPGLIPETIAQMDVVVVPSLPRPGWAEQFGRVVCEAMFAGVPVVASRSGSLSEVVGNAGILVDELDHYRLNQAILWLRDDEDFRTELGRRGRVWALENLSPEAAAQKLITLWRSIGPGCGPVETAVPGANSERHGATV